MEYYSEQIGEETKRSSGVEIEEGGMGKGDTKASKELNLQKGGQKWVGRDKSLKPEKKAAHKAERSRGKKALKKFKEY